MKQWLKRNQRETGGARLARDVLALVDPLSTLTVYPTAM